jgi:hypothetical protein
MIRRSTTIFLLLLHPVYDVSTVAAAAAADAATTAAIVLTHCPKSSFRFCISQTLVAKPRNVAVVIVVVIASGISQL